MTKPERYAIENVNDNRCDIVLNDNIQEVQHTIINENGQPQEITKYVYDYYRIKDVRIVDTLEEDLEDEKKYKNWLEYAKKQYAGQAEEVSVEERLSAAEAVINEILSEEK